MNPMLGRSAGTFWAIALAAVLLCAGAVDPGVADLAPAAGEGGVSCPGRAEGETASDGKDNADEPSKPKVRVDEWLILGPVRTPLPAFNDEGEGEIGPAELLEYEHVPLKDLRPIRGASVELIGGGDAVWSEASSGTSGVSIAADTSTASIAYLAAYIEVPRWMKVDVEARCTNPFELTIGTGSVVSQKGGAEIDDDEARKKGDAKLEKGKHLMVVKTVYVPADTLADWILDVKLSPGGDFSCLPSVSTDPSRTMNTGDVLEATVVSNVAVSPDGEILAVRMSRTEPPEGEVDGWIEIRRLPGGDLMRTIKDMSDASRWLWAPTGHRLSYMVSDEGVGTVRVIDLETDTVETIVEDVEDLQGYVWSPDGSYVVYSVGVEAEEDEIGVKRMRGIYDRRHYERDKSFLYVSSVPAGMTRRITAGEHSTHVHDVHPRSGSLLIGRSYEDLSERPYDTNELVVLDLDDQSAEIILTDPWLRGAVWSPDGEKILVTAGPSSFGGIGSNVPEGTVPNDYDTQAFIFDPETRTADPITRDFAPSIEASYWPKPGGNIYFVVEEGEYRNLYRYNTGGRTFKKIDLGFDVAHRGAVARDKAVGAFTGSSADRPQALVAVDLARGRVRPMLEPATERFEHVTIGEVEDWSFETSSGVEIIGRVHYPPDFDPSKKWPCIVYYYGGTSPVGRSFGGRYPKNLWASMGYVVYVLQPSGATGFGQEFSAVHVNDWGKTTTGEIIEGTKKFLKAHDFVDPERVGCIGASYGGFMTQLLVTKTDIFAAAVSHAGISDITSYWGEGYWGYLYSGVATANSFPWNRPDIYIGQSPLFAADKVNTPLLLLHGGSDTNVPRGESEQMYTALKLLGKEVEYIRVAGENHWILDYKKRIAWSNAILSWFDKWLKDEPEWWDDMYPPLDGDEAESGAAKGGGATEDEAASEGPGRPGMHRVELDRYGDVLLGEITMRDVVMHLDGWHEGYFNYSPDREVLSILKDRMDGVEMVWVIGTWCSDCKREIPRLWKILDEIGYPLANVKVYAVASSRFTEDMGIPPTVLRWSDEVKDWYDVEAVETIIVMRDGEELGRIVEAPDGSMEVNLLDIVGR
jgi:dipeptidyl aminopeptidase/acylaminoacyl peptidase/thiol-disulfide isomerase/thioredoxin